ncbi:alpha/beta fold hydrolase [Nonomuraea sp. 10N515B]|uniref:alpha/beta fold hydrolase n=1 Tax=Nonomuraea sp. 10N515B TaxID=3457422 RepID=UPI003FCDE97E
MSAFVLIHAFGSGPRAWQPQIDALGAEHRIIAPELPGHGDTPGPLTLDRATAAISEVIIAQPEPVHLVGISGGGTVALLTALAVQERLAGLVVSGASAKPARTDAVQRAIMGLLPADVLAGMFKGMYSGGRPEYVAAAMDDLRRAGKRTLLAGLRELGHLDLLPRLGEIGVPTLVLSGEKDRPNIAHARRIAAAVPGAELRLVPDAGHLWNLEHPGLFSRTLTDFAAGCHRLGARMGELRGGDQQPRGMPYQ